MFRFESTVRDSFEKSTLVDLAPDYVPSVLASKKALVVAPTGNKFYRRVRRQE